MREVCDVVFRGTLSLSKNFWMWELEHTISPPLMFAKFSSPDPTVVASASMNVTINHCDANIARQYNQPTNMYDWG